MTDIQSLLKAALLEEYGSAGGAPDFSSAGNPLAPGAPVPQRNPARPGPADLSLFGTPVGEAAKPRIDGEKVPDKQPVQLSGMPIPAAKPDTRGLLGDIGRLTPEQQIATVQAQKAAAEAQVSRSQSRAAKLAQLKKLDLGNAPEIEQVANVQRAEQAAAPVSVSQDPSAPEVRAGKKVMNARDQLAGKAPLPTQTPLRNAVDVGVRSFIGTGTDVVKAGGIVAGAVPGIPEENVITRVADAAEAKVKEAFPGDNTQAETFTSNLSQGAGSMAGFLVSNIGATAAAKAFGASGRLAGTISAAGTGAAVQGVQGYEEAKQKEVGKLSRYTAFLLNAGLGLSEAAPIDRFFGRLNKGSGGRVSQILADTKAQSLEEFTQEVFQSVGSDVVAKAVYDPDRQVGDGALISGVIGGILGGSMGAAGGAFKRLGRSDAESLPDNTSPEAMPEDLPDPAISTNPEAVGARPGQAVPMEAGVEAAPEAEPLGTELPPPALTPPAAQEVSAEARATLRDYGYDDAHIDSMSGPEIQAETESAAAAGVQPSPEKIADAAGYAQPVGQPASGTRSDPHKAETAEARELRRQAEEIERSAAFADDMQARRSELAQAQQMREQAAELDRAALDRAAANAEASPSEAQKDAGNYRKSHVKAFGLDISIENPKGSQRTGKSPDGEAWQTEMPAHYGYVKRTEGADGDQVDVYLGDDLSSDRAFIVDQVDPATGKFDEHKVILGARSLVDAGSLYQRGFSDGAGHLRMGSITEVPLADFRQWLKSGDTSKPYSPAFQARPHPQAIPAAESGQEAVPVSGPFQAETEQGLLPAKLVRQRPGPTEQGIIGLIRANGGLRPNGDLAAMDLLRSRPGIISKRGKHLDQMRETAAEEGYFDHLYGTREAALAQSTPNDLLSLIDEQLRGNVALPIADQMQQADPWQMTDAQAEEQARAEQEAAGQIDDLLREFDFRISDQLRERAVSLLMTGAESDADYAIERAVIMLENEDRQAASEYVDDFGPIPGFDHEAQQTRAPESPEGSASSIRQDREPESGSGAALGGSRSQQNAAGEDGSQEGGGKSFGSDKGRLEQSEPVSEPKGPVEPPQGTDARKALLDALDEEFGASEEAGADNKPQTVIPGAERARDADIAQRRADAPLRPKRDQKAADIGLFSDEEEQTDFFQPVQGPKEQAKATNSDVSAGEAAKSAATNVAKGLDEATKGLVELFGGGKTVGSGLNFDPETYAKAKPLFKAALQHFQAAATDLQAMARALVKHLRGAGLDRAGIERMLPYLERYMTDVQSGREAIDDVPNSSSDLEQAGGNAASGNGMGAANVPASSGRSERGSGSGARKADDRVRSQQQDLSGVSDGDASSVGADRNQQVQADESGRGGSYEPGDSWRGSDSGDEGLPPVGSGTEDARKDASGPSSVTERIAAQKAAERVRVASGIDNIRRTLPILLPAQQEDVFSAETRLDKPDAFGFMLTNGTGTGKTFSALGLAKRFHKSGRRNILVLAPSKPILEQWADASRDSFFMDLKILDGIEDAGEGEVATTYANFYQNAALQKRDFDLVIPDESQNLMANKTGEANDTTDAFRAITNHPDGLYHKARMWEHKLVAEIDRLRSALKEGMAGANADDRLEMLQSRLHERVQKHVEAFKAKPRSKVLFLSATPFPYDKTVDYANGFLFDYPESDNSGGYNSAQGRNLFFVTNFGYRMRYNKLTEPDRQVNRDLMARQFHEQLRKSGALSGRQIEVDADYDRKFVLIDDAVGTQIDQALEWLSQAGGKFSALRDKISKEFFDYLAQRRLLEAIKARHSIPIIQKHLDLGRKVVVFHEYNQGGGINPFTQVDEDDETEIHWYEGDDRKPMTSTMGDAAREFLAANPYVKDFKFGSYNAPIVELTRAFGDRAAIFNGSVPVKERNRIKKEFNRDGSGLDIVVVNSAAGEAGLSLHDTTGVHQRVLMFLGLPPRPTTAIQGEGRIYRVGQVSDAIFRYLNTGTAWESHAFASTIAGRSGIAESLAMGDLARGLRDSFIEAYQESDTFPPVIGEGTGGKERDRLLGSSSVTPFEKAKTLYFGQQKNTKRRDQREGADYFATPEPLGLKMVEWSGIKSGEKILEPSAGHGAIARWFPEDTRRTLIEPSFNLASRAGVNAPGADVLNHAFEDLHATNKYDAIVMNPPFGMGGATAIKHLEKAARHLRNGGRVVILYPDGPAAEKRMEKFYESDAAKDLFVVAKVHLPSVTFERAGTSVRTSVYVMEKQTEKEDRSKIRSGTRDLANAENVNELFDRLEGIEFPDRVEPSVKEAEEDTLEQFVRGAPIKSPSNLAEDGFDLGETVHGKTGDDIFVASIKKRVERDKYMRILAVAKKYGGWYSSFRGRGAIPGFQFKSNDQRQAFLNEMAGAEASAPETADLSVPPDGWGAVEASPEPRLSAAQVADVQAIVRSVAGLDQVMMPERIDVPAGHAGARAWGNDGQMSAQGFYDPTNDAIAVAMSLPGGRRVAFHESFHRLQNLFLTDREKQLLRAEAGRLRQIIRSDDVRGGQADKMSQKEVEAEAFAIYTLRTEAMGAAGGAGFHIGLRRAWNRILQTVRRVRNFLGGRGFKTFEDVFGAARRGEIAKRPVRAPEGGEASFSIHPEEPIKTGEFSPPSDVRYRHEHWMKRAGGILAAMPTIEQVRRKVQDRFLIVRRYQEQAMEAAGISRLPEQFDVYLAESLYYGRAGERIAELREKIIDPLIERMREKGVSHEQLGLFLYAKHARERNATIAERNPDMPDGGSGLTNAEAVAILRDFRDAGLTNDLEEMAEQVYSMNQTALQMRYSAGLLSREQFEHLKDRWRYYVPLRGYEGMDDGIEGQPVDGPRTGSGFQARGKEFKSALGRGTRADSPLAYSIMGAMEAITRAEKNRVGKTFLRLVQAFPNKKVWEIKSAEVRQRLNPNTGLVEQYVVPLAFTNDQQVFSVKVGGKAMHIVVKDPRVVSAMKNLGSADMSAPVKALSKFTRFYASLQTSWNPEFVLTNFARDLETALGYLGEHDIKGLRRQVVKSTFPAMKGMYRNLHGKTDDYWTNMAARYRDAGGKISFFEYQDIEGLKAQIEKDLSRSRAGRIGRKLMNDLIEIPNGAVENALRLATFEALLKAGATEAKAASAARELTVNFNRKGEYGSVINAFYVFFNASIQGNVRLVQLAAKSPKVRKAILAVAIFGFMMDMLGAAASDDDDDTGVNQWDLIPEWERTRSIIIPGTGGVVKIPLAYGFNIPYVFGQELSRVVRGASSPIEAAGVTLGTFATTMSPVGGAPSFMQFVSPTILEPAAQLAENKNWLGNPIMPEPFGPMDTRPDSQLAFDSVSPQAKWIAETLNEISGGSKYEPGAVDVSPESIELFTEFLTGGIGRTINRAVKTGDSLLNGTTMEPNDIPFVRVFYRGESDFVKRNMFYDSREDIQAAHNAVKQMQKDRRPMSEVNRFKADHRSEIASYNAFKAANKQLSELRSKRRVIEQNASLPASRKKQAVDAIRKQELAVMMKAQKTYMRAKDK